LNTYKLPPHQQLAAPDRWPLVGEKAPDPQRVDGPWCVAIRGLVERECVWTLEALRALPQVERVVDLHCVTRWSKLGVRFGGVPLKALLERCVPLKHARYLSFVARSARGHSTSLPLEVALEQDVLLALRYEGQPLPPEHGGPLRTVVPQRYFYKSLKWLEAIEVLREDRLGYWEREAGYHNAADPWKEQRYIVPHLDSTRYRKLLQKRDFSGQNLLGLDAQGRELSGLNAHKAQLRDAHFERANLEGARFEGANLSNAHFNGAHLCGATFVGADCEGADFRGADVRGADFTRASLFGVTFVDEAPDSRAALVDATTRIDARSLTQLTPPQQTFILQARER